MLIGLLTLIVLILLFGAGVVTGWLKNALGAFLGIVLLAGFIFTLMALFGEDSFWWIWICGGSLLFGAVIWARSYDPLEAEHKARVQRAREQREERRKKGINW